jgi:AcrR family transcriptional regulator
VRTSTYYNGTYTVHFGTNKQYAGDMSSGTTPRSGARVRTQRAILDAAASVLARDRTATIPSIADAAGVGRTTVHRYFPDREALIHATVEDSVDVVQRSLAAAALHEGPPVDAMRRAIAAMVAVGDRLMFLFGDPRALETYGVTIAAMPLDDPVRALITRGQAEDAFDAEVSAAWIQHVLWAVVLRGCVDADSGGLPRHGVVATVIRTLERGILTG